MPFSGVDDIFSNISNGNSFFTIWNKAINPVQVAGRWSDTFTMQGIPESGSYPGAIGSFTLMDDTTPGALYTGGRKDPLSKHLLSLEAISGTATGAGATLMLVDLLMYYIVDPRITTVQTMSGSSGNALPLRSGVQHTGAGVYMFLEGLNTMAASSPYLTISYTNHLGASPRTVQGNPAVSASTTITQIAHSGLGAANYGPFLPLDNGDGGIISVQSVKFSSAGTAGVQAALILCEPLAMVPIGAIDSASIRDFVFSRTTLPRIRGGACLAFLLNNSQATVAATQLSCFVNVAWG